MAAGRFAVSVEDKSSSRGEFYEWIIQYTLAPNATRVTLEPLLGAVGDELVSRRRAAATIR
jgi:hypothetical protein